MIPHVVLGVAALIGLFGWGLKGLIVGAIGGFVFIIALGSIVGLVTGGMPGGRKIRKQTATGFIILHPDLIQSAFPDAPPATIQKAVERCIAGIFRRAAMDNKSMDQKAAVEMDAIQAAASALIAEEKRPEMKVLLAFLLQHIEREIY